MAATAELLLKFTGNNKDLHRTIGESEGKLKGFAAGAGKLALKAGAGIAAGVGAGAAKAVMSFADVERGMNEVFTLLPGISKNAMDQMTGDVLNLSKEMGITTDEAIPALYQALSAGVSQDNVFDFLQSASKAAVGGAVDLETAVGAIQGTVNAYGEDVINADKVSDLLFKTVAGGVTTMDELGSSLFNVTPTAAGLGVGLEDVSAAMVALTKANVPTSVATTQLRSLMVELSKAGGKTAEAFEKVSGKSFADFVAGGGSVQDALGLMSQAAEDNGVAIQDMFGSVEAGSAALVLTSAAGSKSFSEAMESMSESSGATQAAFEQMDQGLSRSWDRIKISASAALTSVGQKLAPFVEKALDWFQKVLPDALDFFSNTFTNIMDAVGPIVQGVISTVKPILDNLGALFTELLPVIQGVVETIVGFFQGRNDALAPSIGRVVEKIVGLFRESLIPFFMDVLIPAVQRIVEKVNEFMGKLAPFIEIVVDLVIGLFRDNFLPFFRDTLLPFVEMVVDGIIAAWDLLEGPITIVVGVIVGVIEGIITVLGGVLDFIRGVFTGDWETAWGGIKAIFEGAWDAIVAVVEGAFILIGSWVLWGIDNAKRIFNIAWGHLRSAWDAAWGGLKDFVFGIWEGIKNAAKAALDWIKQNVIRPFINAINSAISAVNNISPVNIPTVSHGVVSVVPGAASVPGGGYFTQNRAHGGPIPTNQPFWVGEQGPELMNLGSTSGRVFSNRQSMAMAGGGHITINVMGSVISERDLAETLGRRIAEAQRRNGVA